MKGVIKLCNLWERTRPRVQDLAPRQIYTIFAQLSELPVLHRDPFDRMLICQAQAHGLTLASSDPLIKQYSIAIALNG